MVPASGLVAAPSPQPESSRAPEDHGNAPLSHSDPGGKLGVWLPQRLHPQLPSCPGVSGLTQ